MAGKIFISYSHSDEDVAERISSKLADKGLEPWIDRQEIRPGQSFIAGMNEGVASASYVLVLLSEASGKSDWVGREWMSALAGKIPVLPVLLKGGELPALLKDVVYFDLRSNEVGGIEKIAAFFEVEGQSVPTSKSRALTESPLKGANRRQLRLVAVRCLDHSGVSAFCFDAEIDIKALHGDSVLDQIVSLLHEVATEGLTLQFANWILIEKRRCVDRAIAELKDAGSWEWG